MWTTQYEATTTSDPEAVWAAIEALHSGIALGPGSDRFELHGPFAVGTALTVTPQGQDAMRSEIIELDPERTAYRDALTALAADEARAQTLAAQHAVARANAEAALPAALPGGAQDEAVPATYR